MASEACHVRFCKAYAIKKYILDDTSQCKTCSVPNEELFQIIVLHSCLFFFECKDPNILVTVSTILNHRTSQNTSTRKKLNDRSTTVQ